MPEAEIPEFPIGLILLTTQPQSEVESLNSPEIAEIKMNKFALELLEISKLTTEEFKLQSMKFIKKDTNDNLYNGIVFSRQTCSSSTYTKNSNKTVHIKIKRDKEFIYIVLEDYEEDRIAIQQKFLASIPQQHLITINHELNNFFCGLTTNVEELHVNPQSKEFKNIKSTLELIRKCIKIFILYSRVSMDKINFTAVKDISDLNLYDMFNHYKKKYETLFHYRNLIAPGFAGLKHLLIKTDTKYFRRLISIIFLYIYYKVPLGSRVDIYIQKIKAGVVMNFAFGEIPINGDKVVAYSRQGTKVLMEEPSKMDENEIKKSVMTLDIIEYLIKSICEFLEFECIFPSAGQHLLGTNGKILTVKFNGTYIGFTQSIFDWKSEVGSVGKKGAHRSTLGSIGMFNKLNQSALENNCYSNFGEESPVSNQETRNSTKDVTKRLGQGHFSSLNNQLSSFNGNFEPSKGSPTNTHIKSVKNKTSSCFLNSSYSGIENIPCPTVGGVGNNNNIITGNITINSFYRGDKKLKQPSQDAIHFFQSETSFSLSNDEEKGEIVSNVNIALQKKKKKSSFSHQIVGASNCINSITTVNNINNIKGGINIKLSPPPNLDDTLTASDSIKDVVDQIIETNSLNLNSLLHTCGCNDIAIVDDENAIGVSIMKIIESRNIKSDYWADGKDCYNKIKEKAKCDCDKKYYKLILLDIYMNDWGGICLVNEINKLMDANIIPRKLSVVFISSHKKKYIDLPQYDFIKGFYQKPVTKSTVIQILETFYTS